MIGADARAEVRPSGLPEHGGSALELAPAARGAARCMRICGLCQCQLRIWYNRAVVTAGLILEQWVA